MKLPSFIGKPSKRGKRFMSSTLNGLPVIPIKPFAFNLEGIPVPNTLMPGSGYASIFIKPNLVLLYDKQTNKGIALIETSGKDYIWTLI